MSATSAVPSPIVRRFLAGATWSVAGTVLSQLLVMGSTAIISRLLSKSDFGIYMLVQTTMSTLGIFAGVGLGTMVTRYAAALKEADKSRLERILALGEITVFGFGICTTIGVWALSSTIAAGIFHDSNLANLIRLACGAMLFTTIDNYQKSILIGFERLQKVAFVSVLSATVAALVSLVLCDAYGINGAALALSISSLIQFVFSRIAVRKLFLEYAIHLNKKEWRSEVHLLGSFAFPALLANILVPGALWTSQALLGRAQNGYVELALFGIAMQWFNALLFVPNIANKVLTPLLAELSQLQKSKDVQGIIKYASFANFILTTVVAIIFYCFSGFILKAYGSAYVHGERVLMLIAIAAIFASLVNVPGNLLSAQSRMWLGSIMNFGWGILYVGCSYIFVKRNWGASGLATGLLIAYVIHLTWSYVWMARAVRRTSNIKFLS